MTAFWAWFTPNHELALFIAWLFAIALAALGGWALGKWVARGRDPYYCDHSDTFAMKATYTVLGGGIVAAAILLAWWGFTH